MLDAPVFAHLRVHEHNNADDHDDDYNDDDDDDRHHDFCDKKPVQMRVRCATELHPSANSYKNIRFNRKRMDYFLVFHFQAPQPEECVFVCRQAGFVSFQNAIILARA